MTLSYHIAKDFLKGSDFYIVAKTYEKPPLRQVFTELIFEGNYQEIIDFLATLDDNVPKYFHEDKSL